MRLAVLVSGSGTILQAMFEAGLPVTYVLSDRPCAALDLPEVHRVDTELAAGMAPTGTEPAFAVDGIDELLFGFLARPRYRAKSAVTQGSVGFVATDVGTSWTVQLSDHGMEAQLGANASDLSVQGPACDLYMLVWNRRPLEGLGVNGETALFEEWRRLVEVVW